jgi:hypothetical protein|nr:MAG TPA: hypothetical protein [Caudoviricetes sp.]DAX15796.1 MAG TPA: hypothetical protein [Caudoviricetes sp.]
MKDSEIKERVYTLLGYALIGVVAFVVVTGTRITKI